MRNFPTCHCHPQSLDSASTPEAFAKRELELGTGTLTVTDHGSLSACRRVYDIAKAKKLTPVIGLEAYFRDDNCPLILGEGIQRDDKGTLNNYAKYFHFTIHFLDQEAYETGVRLLSKAPLERHGRELKPIFNWNDVEELGSKNLIVTSGCLIGIVQRHFISQNNGRLAVKYYERFKSLLKPGNWYVEVFPHVTDKYWEHKVFITLEGGEKLRFYDKKKLKTNAGEVDARKLAADWAKSDHGEHEQLLGVKNYHTWEERSPAKIVNVEYIEDFLLNECKPWSPTPDYQLNMNRFMIGMAKKYGDPILIADDSHFAHAEDKVVQDIRLQAGGDSWRFAGSYHRQDSDEAFRHFNTTLGVSQAQYESWVDNCYEWASRFKDFKFDYKPSLPTKFYPSDSLRHTMDLVKKHGRMDWNNQAYVERLKTEIQLLHKNGVIDLLPYFFIGEEALYLYEQNHLLTGPGRGSAAGLLLTYLLGITHVDPLRYGLSLERFLTLDRIKSGKLPDIDMDFPHRDLLVGEGGWLEKRFPDHFAQISVDTTLKLRSSVKDVARVVHGGKIPDDTEALTKKFTNAPQGVTDVDHVFGYDAGGHWEPGAIEHDEALKTYVERYPQEWEIVRKCLGLARQKGRHACAYVIANRPIAEFIPLTKVSDVTVTEYTAGAVEAAGGIKMDFLVINSLNDISDCIKLVQQRSGMEVPDNLVLKGKRVPRIRLVPFRGELVDIWDLPEDQGVFNDVASGRTETVFQFNTPGAVQWLQHFNYERSVGVKAIRSIEDMSAFTALDRPGPLNVKLTTPGGKEGERHNALVEYARRARGEEPTPDILKIFDELLPETYGVMVYQEQLQRTYQYFTDCTGAEAEAFRGFVAKKQQEKLQKTYPFFIERATAKLGSEDLAKRVWEFYQTWGQYGFNKSHSVCYSVIGYACAFLKHHYPLEWWCAVLRNAEKGEVNERFWRYVKDIVDLPDVKLSGPTWEIQGERLRAPISLLHGVGPAAHKQLVENAPYESMAQFCQRMKEHQEAKSEMVEKVTTDKKTGESKTGLVKKKGHNNLTRKVVTTLVIGGAMDSLFPPGTDVLEMLQEYEIQLAAAMGKKKVEKVPEHILYISPLGRYQLRKKILPAYSADLYPMVSALKDSLRGDVLGKRSEVLFDYAMKVDADGHAVVEYTRKGGEPETYVFHGAKTIEQINSFNMLPQIRGGYKLAVCAYVEEWRKFNYGVDKKRTAVAMTLDIEGAHMEFVKWGGARALPENFSDSKAGCVVIALLNKFAEDRPFAIDDLIVVSGPIKDMNTKEESA